ncbi:MAG: Asp-tRNA(Asn)/Glu-tRNA(Gln) amidotransferase subunit GatB [Fusobacteriaceae bacterium]|jgi:aspartyl-tRNA(Asn)/glutamyl-tRNA(Gln) amidotransferase subunit B|nr:Asp-tRNA(Asn)/Glu-tRNA(Gln) amidotransferase subunit GatB [Fusobacteriaceae bacterium]
MQKQWESVIGLEVHLQLKTKTKVWCGCSADYDQDPPNTHTCPICLGHPGTLPKLNKKVVEYAVKGALALNCSINRVSAFDRKNYFYPDMPKNYQITQFDKAFAEKGALEFKLKNGKEVRVGITKIQIEEDTGKSIHVAHESLMNYNRAGIPLIEIISDPDLRSSEEAYEYLNTLKSTIKYTGISDVSMESGSLRCDANVSVMEKGSKVFGTRVEIKNMNSFKAVARAIDYEIGRQISELEEGGEVFQETRLWDEDQQITVVMRSKEEAMDYRYFPEPDLLRLVIDDAEVEAIRKTLPETRGHKMERFIKEYGVSEYDAALLSADREISAFFEEVVRASNNPKASANWVLGEVFRVLKEREIGIEAFPMRAVDLGTILKLIDKGDISGKLGKELFEKKLYDLRSPETIVREDGMIQVSDRAAIEALVGEVLTNNAVIVDDYYAADDGRKPRVLKGLVGQVMKASKGKANPNLVTEILLEKLK